MGRPFVRSQPKVARPFVISMFDAQFVVSFDSLSALFLLDIARDDAIILPPEKKANKIPPVFVPLMAGVVEWTEPRSRAARCW